MSDFIQPDRLPAWEQLSRLATDHDLSLDRLLDNPQRANNMVFEGAGLTLDATRQLVDTRVMQALMQLANQARVLERAHQMFQGQSINLTEQRAVLHVALRGSHLAQPPWGDEVSATVATELDRFLAFAEHARVGRWTGWRGDSITDIVNIGIGGSDLGPRMASQALARPGIDVPSAVRIHYVSNVDADALGSTLASLHPERTGFIVQSKTFTTQETLMLAESARRWLADAGCPSDRQSTHWVAVTAKPELARQQGVDPAKTFVFWDWVGGRYSVWSAIGLPLAIAIGASEFRAFLRGAHAMDQHFMSAPAERNMPLLMALWGLWNTNWLGASTLNIAPYAYALSHFVAFVQQLEMESNGKSTHLNGRRVSLATAPVVWGGLGIDGQHAYFQLIHQGTHRVPVDFIGVRHTRSLLPLAEQHQRVVLQNMTAQAQALALGRDVELTMDALRAEGYSEAEARSLCPHRTYAGNTPSSIIWMDNLTPEALGALIALYEHKVFCQAAIWGINAFDQWGVELGKTMVRQMKPQASGA